MKRDLDFTRELLLAIEDWTPSDSFQEVLTQRGVNTSTFEADCNLRYHAHILRGAGYMDAIWFALEMGDTCPFKDFDQPSLT